LPPPRAPVSAILAPDQRVRTRDLDRGEVTAYQDGVRLGRAIVPAEAIAPDEAPPAWNELVRFVGSSWSGSLLGPGAGVAEVGPAGVSQPWRYVPLILYGWATDLQTVFASARF
jgi:hypothetical protein